MFHLFDTYSAGISLLCSALFEAVAVSWFYGKFYNNRLGDNKASRSMNQTIDYFQQPNTVRSTVRSASTKRRGTKTSD